MGRWFAIAVGVFVWALAAPARATVVGCRAVTAGKTVLNHCNNHDYFPRSQPFRARLEAEGLERLRVALVRARRLPDAPVLIEFQPWRVDTPRIMRRTSCRPSMGDSDAPSVSLGACILISAEDLPRRWSTLRTALVAATRLSARRAVIELDDLPQLARRVGAARHRGLVVMGRTYAAPRGPFALRERWQDGRLAFLLLRRGRVVRRLPALSGFIVAPPQWHKDGQAVSLGTLAEVVRFRVTDGRTDRFDIEARLPKDATHYETRWRWKGGDVEVAADTALLAGYRAWRWSPDTGKVLRLQKDGDPPF